ncbi:unnamed protein product [Brassica rapa subsp. trilocularis]
MNPKSLNSSILGSLAFRLNFAENRFFCHPSRPPKALIDKGSEFKSQKSDEA